MEKITNHPDAMGIAMNDRAALVWLGDSGWCIMPNGGTYALPCGPATANLAIRKHNMKETRFPDGILYSA